MLHWESDGSQKIEVCKGECTSHTGENVESLWYAFKENSKNEKWWVAPELFRVQNMRLQNPPKSYTKKVAIFMISILGWQLYDQGQQTLEFSFV